MRIGWFIGLAVAAVVLDSAVAPEIEFLGARPDFLVLFVAYSALVLGARPATLAGFILGLIVDAEQPEYLGLHALALSVIGYASAVAWEHLVRGSLFVQITVLFGAALRAVLAENPVGVDDVEVGLSRGETQIRDALVEAVFVEETAVPDHTHEVFHGE